MLSNSHVILSVSEGSQDPNMRFFLPLGRQNDKMIVSFHFDTPSYTFIIVPVIVIVPVLIPVPVLVIAVRAGFARPAEVMLLA